LGGPAQGGAGAGGATWGAPWGRPSRVPAGVLAPSIGPIEMGVCLAPPTHYPSRYLSDFAIYKTALSSALATCYMHTALAAQESPHKTGFLRLCAASQSLLHPPLLLLPTSAAACACAAGRLRMSFVFAPEAEGLLAMLWSVHFWGAPFPWTCCVRCLWSHRRFPFVSQRRAPIGPSPHPRMRFRPCAVSSHLPTGPMPRSSSPRHTQHHLVRWNRFLPPPVGHRC
jgi:hypothetical protein